MKCSAVSSDSEAMGDDERGSEGPKQEKERKQKIKRRAKGRPLAEITL
jgi:hypothetical protein